MIYSLTERIDSFLLMFDFQKLLVYEKAKAFNNNIGKILEGIKLEPFMLNQLKRAAFSIMLNVAEGSGRYSMADKRNFYVISRGSVFEVVAVLDYLKDNRFIDLEVYESLYKELEEISKMLFAMIKSLKKN